MFSPVSPPTRHLYFQTIATPTSAVLLIRLITYKLVRAHSFIVASERRDRDRWKLVIGISVLKSFYGLV
jgi:hypothetical protein